MKLNSFLGPKIKTQKCAFMASPLEHVTEKSILELAEQILLAVPTQSTHIDSNSFIFIPVPLKLNLI